MGVLAALLLVGSITTAAPTPTAAEPPLLPALEHGDSGPAVADLNSSLSELGFRPDDGDVFGWSTYHAVVAFQKHHDRPRDGVFKMAEWALLAEPVALGWRPESDRVEIDLAKQVLYVVRGGAVEAVVPVSSGNGELYHGRGGALVTARTPEGRFDFQRRISGWRISYLGALYNPYYFYGGYAVHGSNSVPTYPASHGCVRVTNRDMDHLKTIFDLGMPVLVYGKSTARPALPPIALPTPAHM